MDHKGQYFFCGVGGSGMLPLALILRARGADVAGSDRALDQGRSADKFDFIRQQGVKLFAQDGSGLTGPEQTLVASAAIEDTVPDVAAALAHGARRVSRAELLSEIFNAAENPIGVAGTSGKSTTTGMLGWILHCAGRAPTVMNGAVMKNFATPDALFASALVGEGPDFVSEVDESDGSIANFNPRIALLNNVTLDHKSMSELRALFSGFVARAETAVLNLDDPETAKIADGAANAITYSLNQLDCDLWAEGISLERLGVSFDAVCREGVGVRISLKLPGMHNISNALAALCGARACGVSLEEAGEALSRYEGVKRRFDVVGMAGGVTVIDDFGHNPDKIAATLRTLHDFPGRLLIMFQPHGFGPLRKMKQEFIDCFTEHLAPEDALLMPDPVYFGGTVDRSVSSGDIVAGVKANGRTAIAVETRKDAARKIIHYAEKGDTIVVMGARDDTLSEFAADILKRIAER